jgi:predicted ATPase
MMMSEAAVTVVKMLETLPEHSKDRAVEHLREYIEELRDEALWDESFARTKDNLAAAARRVRQEIAEGKSRPLNIEDL